MTRIPGTHFLQIPGPTNIPERIARVLASAMIDHRGSDFAGIARETLAGLRDVFRTEEDVALFASSGSGAWQAALINAVAPGEALLLCENGFFAAQWGRLAERLGYRVVRIEGNWRCAPDPEAVAQHLEDDRSHEIKALLIVHSETSTGALACIPGFRKALDSARHPALLMVDTVSSLACADYRHDEWDVDVSIGASQKGLMVPPGIGLNAISEKARRVSKAIAPAAGYWEWGPAAAAAQTGMFPSTPPTPLVRALLEALTMIHEEGLEEVLERHARHASATQEAVQAWELEPFVEDPSQRSPSVTAALFDSSDTLRATVRERYGLTLGSGLDRLAGKVFRIGHLGDFNDLMLCATLSGVQLGFHAMGEPRADGVSAALTSLSERQTRLMPLPRAKRAL